MVETEHAPPHDAHTRRVYHRELPGAGFVAIEVSEGTTASGQGRSSSASRIRVFVERRSSEERRLGHEPPVVAETDADEMLTEIGELYRMASDNVALARALIDWQLRRQPRAD